MSALSDNTRILKALANERRLRILQYLGSSGESSVGDIAEAIKLSLSSTSKHLIILRSAGLIKGNQKSLLVMYSLNKNVPPLAKFLIRAN